ncbi:MAG: D-Ala-D-Ala carboxypeptidase family metallohydrolase [Devosiaceae bacterium]|nr:D-Ala-D-Ala carboxypeptidase family metallohydrolase [Devosiaceae bacterium]
MRKFLTSIFLILALGACVPLAIFADGSSKNYNGYKKDFGTYVASSNVNAFCLTPSLRYVLWEFEGYFGKKIVMNSGYRSPWYNSKIGGARRSLHKKCMAADFFIPGVSKAKLIAYAKRNRMIGGLGCYPGKKFIHIDVRDKPRGYKTAVEFSGC